MRLLFRTVIALCIASLMGLCLVPNSSAELNATDEVNLTDSDDDEWSQRVAVDNSGNFHIIYNYDNGNLLQARYLKINPLGATLASVNGINPTTVDGRIDWMEVAVDLSGNAHVVFSLKLTTDDAANVYYCKISSTGSVQVPAKQVYGSDVATQLPDIAVDSAGNAYITFEEESDPPMIYWMKLSTDGSVDTGPLNVSGDLGFNGDVRRPRIVSRTTGTTYVVWEQQNTAVARWEIFLTTLSSRGDVLTSPISIVSSTLNDEEHVHVDIGPDDLLHLTYVQNDNIMYSKTDSDGEVSVDHQTIADPVVGTAMAADIGVDEDGNAYTAYMQRTSPTSNWRIYVRTRGAADDYWGSSVQIDSGNGSARYPRMGAGSQGVGVAFDRSNDVFWSLVTTGGGTSNNSAPIAVLHSDKTEAGVNETITFDGSDSYDPAPDDQVEQYKFVWGDGEDSGWVTTASLGHKFAQAGDHTVKLYVKDNQSLQCDDPDSVKVSITSTAENKAPVAEIAADKTEITVGGSVTVDAVNSYDPDGEVVEYKFDLGDGYSTDWQSQVVKTHKYTEDGTFKASVQVKDDKGKVSDTPSSITITVEKMNTPPMAVIESISPNPAVEGESVKFKGYGIDEEDTIAEYQWGRIPMGIKSRREALQPGNVRDRRSIPWNTFNILQGQGRPGSLVR